MKFLSCLSAVFLALFFAEAMLPPASAEGMPKAPPIFTALNHGTKQTVLVYGTSLTAGGAWARELKKWFDTNYPGLVTFVNSGGPGQNSDWGVTNLQSKVLDKKPDLVFIEFAYNDAHEKFAMPVERGASNLDKIVQGIRAANPQTTIVLQTMNVPYDAANGNRSASARAKLQEFNDNYRKYAREHDLPLLDHYVAWKKFQETDRAKYEKEVPDGTHPNAEGSLAVTWPTIQEWLEKSRKEAQP